MKTCLKAFLMALSLAALLGTSITNTSAQTTQNFSWTVTGTGTETWATSDLSYTTRTISAAMPTQTLDGGSNLTWQVVAAGTGPCNFSANDSANGSGNAGLYIHDLTGQQYILSQNFNYSDPNQKLWATNGTFTATDGHTYDFTVVADGENGSIGVAAGRGAAQISATFPDHYQINSHIAIRTGTATGNNFVSPSDGQKNLWGFAPSATPLPQNGGTISGISYSITWNNPNVSLVFSDTMTTTTLNPNAYIFAAAPVPGQVTSLGTTTNYAVNGGSVTIGNSWAATPLAFGYEFISIKYFNGVWQTPVTNFVAGTSYLDTGIPPGTPCGYYVIATNGNGFGPVSWTNWPIAVLPPLPGQVASLGTTTNYAASATSTTLGNGWTSATMATGYQVVTAKYIGGVWQPLATNFVSGTSYVETGIPPGTPYECYVIATNASGFGPASATNWPVAAVPPQMTGDIVTAPNYAVAAGDGVMGFSWPAATNAPIVGYEAVFDHYTNGVWPAPVTNFTTQPSIVYSNVVPGDPYAFYVVAVNGAGVGLASAITWPLAAGHIPGPIATLWTSTNHAFSPSSATIGCAWTPCAGVSGFESTYVAIMSEYANGLWQPLTTNYTSGTNFTYTGMVPGAPFEFYVYATNNAGFGPSSETNWPTVALYFPPANTLFPQPLGGGKMRFTFAGDGRANYILERSYSLQPADWVPQMTNPADADGNLIFTNAPNPNTNNFWRIRSWP